MADDIEHIGTLEIGGVKIPIIRDADMAKAKYVACTLWTDPPHFPDNHKRVCCRCFRPVQVRPYVPLTLHPVCIECVVQPTH